MSYAEWVTFMEEQDPDSVVDVLGLTSEEILLRFEDRAAYIWRESYGGE